MGSPADTAGKSFPDESARAPTRICDGGSFTDPFTYCANAHTSSFEHPSSDEHSD
jgi:hypothetical protein